MSDFEAARLLNSAIATLERAVVPALSDDESKIALDLVIRVLNMLGARLSTQEQGLEKLLTQSRSLLNQQAADLTPPAPASEDGKRSGETRLQRLESQRDLVDTALSHLIPKLVAEAAKEGIASDAGRALQQIIGFQREYLAKQDPDILKGTAVVFRGGRIDRQNQPAPSLQKTIDEAGLTAYLRNKFPEAGGISARDVKILRGGFSKVTALFTMDAPGKEPERLVLRKDLPVLFMNKSIENEFPLLQKLYGAGIKVAEPRWMESDATHFDGSFLVSNFAKGKADVQHWRFNPAAVKGVSRGLAEVLASFHKLDLGAIGYGPEATNKSAGEAISDEIASWDRLYSEWRRRPCPLIDIPLAWVKQNIPRHLFNLPARVVHGDVGFHNLMVEDGQITALLDWEFAHFGDPVEDLAYARPFLEQVSAWDDFLGHYRECGGLPYSEECERFYQIWSLTRNPIGTLHALSIFQNSLPDEIKLAIAGYIFSPYLQLDGSTSVMNLLQRGK